MCVFLSLSHPLSLKHTLIHTHRYTHVPLDLISEAVYLAGRRKMKTNLPEILKMPWRGRRSSLLLSPPPSYSTSYQSLPPSTCVSPTLYLQLPASLRPCRMTWHECRRHRYDEACKDVWIDGWVTHTLLATRGRLNMMMTPGNKNIRGKQTWRSRHGITDTSTHIWFGACHGARTSEGHKLVTSFVDHKTANWRKHRAKISSKNESVTLRKSSEKIKYCGKRQ